MPAIFSLALDPIRPGTLYMGSHKDGIWRSDDCGADWSKANTGANGPGLDSGMSWSLVVSPKDGSVYTTAGYGALSVFKSKDDGHSWTDLLSPELRSLTGNGFVEKITLDPTKPDHIVVSFHSACSVDAYDPAMSPGAPIGSNGLPVGAVVTGAGWGCLLESYSAGESLSGNPAWTVTTSAIPWEQADGVGQTMFNEKTWFYGTYGYDGVYRTTTGGVSPDGVTSAWKKVLDSTALGGVYVSPDRKFIYTGLAELNYSEVDPSDIGGLGSWTAATGRFDLTFSAYNGSIPIVQIGSKLVVSVSAQPWLTDAKFLFAPTPLGTAPAAALGPFSALPTTTADVPNGQAISLQYDSTHRVLYAINFAGVWRYVVPATFE